VNEAVFSLPASSVKGRKYYTQLACDVVNSTLHIFRKPTPRILSFYGKAQEQSEELSTIFLEI